MKKILYSLLLATGMIGGLSSCADFLEIEPQNEILFENFWNEKADVDAMVFGCYARMQDDDVLSRMLVWGEFRSDNLTFGVNIENNGDLNNIMLENLRESNGYATWDPLYAVINRCNTVIKFAPMVAERDLSFSEGELKATIAEMSALRDLCYFYLIRTFRDVPYSTVAYTDDDQKFDLPATPFYDVLDSLICDLESVKGDAVVKYPEDKKNYQTGRITQEAIYAMLCEMYLWKKDYANCIRYADLVIESKKKQEEERIEKLSGTKVEAEEYLMGYPLIPTGSTSGDRIYGNAYTSIFGDGNSREGIFELTFDKLNTNMPANGVFESMYGSSNGGGLVAPPIFIAEDISNKTYKVFDSKLDARFYENIGLDGPVVRKGVAESAYIDASNPDNVQNEDGNNLYPQKQNRCNFILYRLTDIMLLKAEALVQSMSDASADSLSADNEALRRQAFTLVNVVNKRSLCQLTLKDTLLYNDYGTKAQMEELVLLERQRELMFEGKRWFDLVRDAMRTNSTRTLLKNVLQKYTSNTSIIQNKLLKMDAIFWPIHEDELKVNKSLKQNPIYAAGDNESYEKNY